MIVLIDIGNTRIKWAVAQDKNNKRITKNNEKINHNIAAMNISEGQAVNYTDENHEQVLEELVYNWQELEVTPSRVIVSNVGDQELADELDNYLWESFQIEPEYLKSSRKFKKLKNSYDKPAALGIDRWLNLIGAYEVLAASEEKMAYCVIDCGTAITIDVVDSKAQHLGGFITPGIKLMQNSLLEKSEVIKNTLLAKSKPRTSKVKSTRNSDHDNKSTLENDPNYDNAFLASNTKQAIDGGIYYSVIAYIERIITDIAQNLNAKCKIFLTGGDSEKLSEMLNIDSIDMIDDVEYSQELIWQGMLAVI